MTNEVVTANWWARGLLFENCSCQLVCPGHMHFEQECTYDQCLGYWAIRIDEGEFESVSLGGLKALVAFISPKRMLDGGWKQRIIIDTAASLDQKDALETILLGNVGGPWAVLARFVGEHVEAKSLPIEMTEVAPVTRSPGSRRSGSCRSASRPGSPARAPTGSGAARRTRSRARTAPSRSPRRRR